MKFCLPTTLSLLKLFGRVRFTRDDFMALTSACGVEVLLSARIKKGRYFYTRSGRHVIMLSSLVTRAEREQIAWHEFAHFLQNYLNPVPMRAGYCTPENRTKREQFADLFAFVCVTGVPLCGRMDFIETLMTEDWK